MKPAKFKEATVELKKPASMTDEECGSLYIYQNPDGTCISLWKASLWQRFKFLFYGRIWLGVLSGKTQPPVWLDCTKTVFLKPKAIKKEEPKENICYKSDQPCVHNCAGLCKESC